VERRAAEWNLPNSSSEVTQHRSPSRVKTATGGTKPASVEPGPRSWGPFASRIWGEKIKIDDRATTRYLAGELSLRHHCMLTIDRLHRLLAVLSRAICQEFQAQQGTTSGI